MVCLWLMVLSDQAIKQAIEEKKLIVKPFIDKNIQPASIDLLMGNHFLIFKNTKKPFLDVKRDDPQEFMEEVVIENGEPIIIHPREFVLGTTKEWFEIPGDLVARLEGKSSLGRLGIVVHATAGYVDPGFKGELTLEITNMANIPIALYAGMKIAQISFFKMTDKPKVLYGAKNAGSHYQGQRGATASRYSDK